MKIPTKTKLFNIIEKIKLTKCCPNNQFCSCKPGGKGLDSGYWYSENRGCYELKIVLDLLNKISEKEYRKILEREK